MKKIILLFVFGFNFVIAQGPLCDVQLKFSPYSRNFTAYKTADDFFNKKNGIIYVVREVVGNKIKCIDTNTNKKYSINLLDSNYFGYNMKGDGPESMRFVQLDKKYYTYGGGNKSLFFIISLQINVGAYSPDGYLDPSKCVVGTFLDCEFNIYYVKPTDNNSLFNEIAKDKPDLANEYKKEKESMKKMQWTINLIPIAIKYTKRYNGK